jgi:segregation and condensation protein A
MSEKEQTNVLENTEDFTENVEIEEQDLQGETLKYNFKLDNYEGPLDLLLDLIKKSKMDIMDIQLSLITDQYMLYMKSLEILDLERATEFLTVAATLLEIKSKSVLPTEQIEFEEDDPERNLLLQIQEYKLLKDASEKLQLQENIDRFYKKADENVGKTQFVLPQFIQMQSLIDAFVEIMARVDKIVKSDEPKNIDKDRFTVAEKIASIKDSILIRKRIKFEQLFEENQTKGELINIFLALLELMKSQIICVKQRNIYGQIEIVAKEYEEDEPVN